MLPGGLIPLWVQNYTSSIQVEGPGDGRKPPYGTWVRLTAHSQLGAREGLSSQPNQPPNPPSAEPSTVARMVHEAQEAFGQLWLLILSEFKRQISSNLFEAGGIAPDLTITSIPEYTASVEDPWSTLGFASHPSSSMLYALMISGYPHLPSGRLDIYLAGAFRHRRRHNLGRCTPGPSPIMREHTTSVHCTRDYGVCLRISTVCCGILHARSDLGSRG